MKLQEKILNLSVKAHLGVEQLKDKCKEKLKDDEGASTVEYVLLLAVIVVGIVGAASFMVPQLKAFFLKVVDKIVKMGKV